MSKMPALRVKRLRQWVAKKPCTFWYRGAISSRVKSLYHSKKRRLDPSTLFVAGTEVVKQRYFGVALRNRNPVVRYLREV